MIKQPIPLPDRGKKYDYPGLSAKNAARGKHLAQTSLERQPAVTTG